MAKVKVEVDIEDWFDSWSGEGLADTIRKHLAGEVIKQLKRDQSYKKFIDKQVMKTLSELEM